MSTSSVEVTGSVHVCELFHFVQIDYFFVLHHGSRVGKDGATKRSLGRRGIRTEVGSRDLDCGHKFAKGLADGLVQPVRPWGALHVLLHCAKEISDYLRRFRDMVFCLFWELGQARPGTCKKDSQLMLKFR